MNYDKDIPEPKDQYIDRLVDEDNDKPKKKVNKLEYCGPFHMKVPDEEKRQDIIRIQKENEKAIKELEKQKKDAIEQARLNPQYIVPQNGSILGSTIDPKIARNAFLLKQQSIINNSKIDKRLEKERIEKERRLLEEQEINEKKQRARKQAEKLKLKELEEQKERERRDEQTRLEIQNKRIEFMLQQQAILNKQKELDEQHKIDKNKLENDLEINKKREQLDKEQLRNARLARFKKIEDTYS